MGGVGGIVLGGFSVGILNYCGFGFGVWAIGGCVTAWNAIGGCAVAFNAATGGVAVAQHFAAGGVAIAQHPNDVFAQTYMENNGFFRIGFLLITKWIWPIMIGCSVPSLLISSALRRRARKIAQS